MRNSVSYPILRRMLGYIDDQTTSNALTNILAWACYKMHAYATKWSISWLKVCTNDIAFSMLKDISPCILKRKTIIWSIPMCYSKCYNVDIFSLEEVAYVHK